MYKLKLVNLKKLHLLLLLLLLFVIFLSCHLAELKWSDAADKGRARVAAEHDGPTGRIVLYQPLPLCPGWAPVSRILPQSVNSADQSPRPAHHSLLYSQPRPQLDSRVSLGLCWHQWWCHAKRLFCGSKSSITYNIFVYHSYLLTAMW